MTGPSELEILVETERRLDAAINTARRAAEATREAARARTALALSELERRLQQEQARALREVADDLAARERAVEQAAIAATTRYETVDGAVLEQIARILAERVLAIASEEP